MAAFGIHRERLAVERRHEVYIKYPAGHTCHRQQGGIYMYVYMHARSLLAETGAFLFVQNGYPVARPPCRNAQPAYVV